MKKFSKVVLSLLLVAMLSALAFGLWSVMLPEEAHAVAYTVTLTSDTPAAPLPGVVGELRWAINMANASVGVPDVITFALPGPGVNTIVPAAPLPAVTDTVLIDGYTQPGSVPPGAGTPAVILVELNGSAAGAADGLVFQGGPASNSQVRGLAVNRFLLNGILIQGTSAITVDGNNVGTDAVGGTALGNWQNGVFVQAGASFNVIGGPNPANRNVISGNSLNGVHIDNSSSNLVEGNYVGTDATGTAPLGNNLGVFLGSGSTGNTIGGTTAGQRNVISSNNSNGVAFNNSPGNFIQGNYVGTDVSGTAVLSNYAPGVYIYNGANNNVVGGNTAGHRNLISGNWGAGVMIDSSTGCAVSGNYVGTDASGGVALPNGTGVYLSGGSGHTVGGATSADGNLISGNWYQGVYITSSTGNTVSANLIGTDAAGSAALGNSQDGVWLNGADSNTIGGTTAGQRNVVSYSGWAGVRLSGSNTNTVCGNYVGTNAAGGAALPNAQRGVLIEGGSTGNTIGGNTSGHLNLISGNAGSGVDIDASSGNFVKGNHIGTDAAGGGLGNSGDGVYLSNGANSNSVGGTTSSESNVISGNSGDGIEMNGSSSNLVEGNYLGTDAAGTAALANGSNGIYLNNGSNGNTIGGAAAGQRNLVSGNASNGIRVEGSDSNVIRGNYVGINAAGGTAVANGVNGIYLFGGSDGNTIGGSAAGEGNVVSGNASNGIRVETSGGNAISGNRVGTDASGAAAVPNGWNGVYVANSGGNTIGGATSGHRNVISGNSSHGVWLMAGSTGNAVEGNYIGTDSTGGARLQNNFFGVNVSNANGNTIGGAGAGQRNVISGNNGTGVVIDVSDNNNVYGNYIGTNAAGSAALKNNGSGVFLGNGAAGNRVGGSAAGQGNLISGNGQDGVRAGIAQANTVQGNYIGTNASGTAAVRNELNGVSIDTISTGMVIGGGGAGEGNLISGNASDGVQIENSTGNYVRGNRIGISAAGGALANLGNGVYLRSGANNNTVGGGGAGEGNLISGNTSDGIEVDSSSANTVQGNYIGTDAAGSNALANGGYGVYLLNSANSSVIGGTTAGQRNLISGNQFSGVHISNSDDCDVYGNYIGTDASGGAALGNSGAGVYITAGSDGSEIGGGGAGQRNLISGNQGDGVSINNVSSGTVAGNYVGIGADGSTSVANGNKGIRMNGATFTTIGGSAAGQGNVISGNTGDGVYLDNSDDNFLQGNYVGTDASGISVVGNGGGGITLASGSNSNTIGGDTAGHRNVISGNTSDGVLIDASLHNNLWGNHIGTDAAGSASLANHRGIYLFDGADSNHIGGSAAGEGNVISGNTLEGIYSYNSSDNDIQGNRVGTNASGMAGISNQTGVYLDDNSSSNRVGGSSAGSGNLISSNVTYGVRVRNSSGNSIQGNRVGTNAAGTLSLGNGQDGIFAADSDQTTVGGEAASAESNLISGNGGNGVYIYRSVNCYVQGNHIGTDAAGTADLGNASSGVHLHECAGSNYVGGGATEANLISRNDGHGVSITGSTDCQVYCNQVRDNGGIGVVAWDAASIRNQISRNSIYGNGGLGIDLMGDGVTPNDGNNNNPAKADRGYNFPVFTETEYPVVGGDADVSGTAPPNAHVEFYYVGAAADPSGHGEGHTYLGTADAGGSGDFSATLSGLSAGDWISAIAISPTGDASGQGNTSEFSANVQVQQGYAVNASVGGGSGTVDPESQAVYAGEDASIDIYPGTYYVIQSITDNGAPAAVANPYVISGVGDDHDVVVTFALESYAVNASVTGGGGTVDPASQEVQRYSSASIDLIPNPGYHVASITDNGVPAAVADPYVISNVTAVHNVVVTFARDISPLAAWYLAEGSTDWGFDCYVSVVNPNDEAVEVQVTYMTSTGPVAGPTVNMPAKSQATVFPSATLGAKDFSTKVECSGGQAISVDRTMYWTGAGAPCSEAHCATGVTAPAQTWYMPEGSSAWGFECWLLIQNPNPSPAQATVTWMVQGAGPQQNVFTIGANSRATYNMADWIGEADASIRVEADKPVIPERAMYRNDRREGHGSGGTTTPAQDYYLAEGCTGFGFTTWVLVQNPQSTPTDVTVYYQAASGPVTGPSFQMPANSRVSINVNDSTAIPGPDPSFSTRVHGSQPIIAERAMYWNGGPDLAQVCHDSIGLSAAHHDWYLADGQTSEGRETWTLVQNPHDIPVEVRVSYLPAGGGTPVVFTDIILPSSRKTYNMADRIPSGRAAVMVEAIMGGPVMCERAMYWNDRGAGTDTIGGYSD